jgi:hypothetical protein
LNHHLQKKTITIFYMRACTFHTKLQFFFSVCALNLYCIFSQTILLLLLKRVEFSTSCITSIIWHCPCVLHSFSFSFCYATLRVNKHLWSIKRNTTESAALFFFNEKFTKLSHFCLNVTFLGFFILFYCFVTAHLGIFVFVCFSHLNSMSENKCLCTRLPLWESISYNLCTVAIENLICFRKEWISSSVFCLLANSYYYPCHGNNFFNFLFLFLFYKKLVLRKPEKYWEHYLGSVMDTNWNIVVDGQALASLCECMNVWKEGKLHF